MQRRGFVLRCVFVCVRACVLVVLVLGMLVLVVLVVLVLGMLVLVVLVVLVLVARRCCGLDFFVGW
jgi:hypothetical protein